MTIITSTFGLAGQDGVTPRRVQFVSTDTLATITGAGYLTQQGINPSFVYATDVFDVQYNYNVNTGVGTYVELIPTITAGVITLSEYVSAGNVTISGSVTAGHLAEFSATTNAISDSGIIATDVVQTNADNQMGSTGIFSLFKANGTESSNAVTASGQAGIITTSSLTTAGGSSYSITWTNSFMNPTSGVVLTIGGGTNTTENITLKVTPGNSTATLIIYNNTTATALNGTILINYLVM